MTPRKKKQKPVRKQQKKEANAMNIDSMTLGELKQIQALFGNTQQPKAIGAPLLDVGKCYMVQTATGFWMTGRVAVDAPDHYELTKAAWIAHTGKFHETLESLQFTSVETLPMNLRIAKQAVVMAVEIAKEIEKSR